MERNLKTCVEKALNLADIFSTPPEVLIEEIDSQLPGILDGISDCLEGTSKISANKSKAVQRIVPLLERELKVSLPSSRYFRNRKPTEEQTMNAETKAPPLNKPAAKAPAKKPAAKAPAKERTPFELQKITVLMKNHGYTEGSKKEQVFLLAKNGMKVADFLDACGKLKMDHEKARSSLKRMIKFKKVKVA